MIENPYYGQYEHLLDLDEKHLSIIPFPPVETYADAVIEAIKAREYAVRHYAFAVPDEQALLLICQYAPKVVELGAGLGYWAWMLTQAGCEVLAYDDFTWPRFFTPDRQLQPDLMFWFPVQRGGVSVLQETPPEYALMLCWPPYNEPMAAQALDIYRGDTLIYIGEGAYGATADDRFHEMLESAWTEVGSHRIPQWYGLHDDLRIYKRKSGRVRIKRNRGTQARLAFVKFNKPCGDGLFFDIDPDW